MLMKLISAKQNRVAIAPLPGSEGADQAEGHPVYGTGKGDEMNDALAYEAELLAHGYGKGTAAARGRTKGARKEAEAASSALNEDKAVEGADKWQKLGGAGSTQEAEQVTEEVQKAKDLRSVDDYLSETQQTLQGYTNVVLDTDESMLRLATHESKIELSSAVDLSRAASVEGMRTMDKDDLEVGTRTPEMKSFNTLKATRNGAKTGQFATV